MAISRKALKPDAVFTSTAAALWIVTFLGYGHQGLLQPILPLYLKQLGGSELLIGFALAAFSLTSFSLRPAIGFLTDEWRVAGVLTVGVLVLGLGGIALFVPWVWLIFVSNAVRGIGWAALNTAGGTLLAHIAPVARRAEAAGYRTRAPPRPSAARWRCGWQAWPPATSGRYSCCRR